MRKLKAAIFLAALVLAPSMTATSARADDGAWCAYGGGADDYENCSYPTLQSCIASVRGVGGACRPNPYFRGGGYGAPYDDVPPPPPPRGRRY